MKTTTSQTIKKVIKIGLIVSASLAVLIIGYRYYNRPVQTWNADAFEGRNPDKIAVKGQGQKYWQASEPGQGFYITDVTVDAGATKTYCVSGAVGGDAGSTADFTFGGQSTTAKNGFFTSCAAINVGDKRQVSFAVVRGELQVYRVDRKR